MGFRGKNVASLFITDRWQGVLLCFAQAATFSVADCERKHAYHKALASGSTTTTFVSLMTNSINDESRNLFLQLQKKAQRPVERSGSKRKLEEVRPNSSLFSSTQVQSQKAKVNGLLLFRRQLAASDKASGIKRQWLSKDTWVYVKERFASLTQQEKQHWDRLAHSVNFRNSFTRRTERARARSIDNGAPEGLAQISDIGDQLALPAPEGNSAAHSVATVSTASFCVAWFDMVF